jgi:hypothetical protein
MKMIRLIRLKFSRSNRQPWQTLGSREQIGEFEDVAVVVVVVVVLVMKMLL